LDVDIVGGVNLEQKQRSHRLRIAASGVDERGQTAMAVAGLHHHAARRMPAT